MRPIVIRGWIVSYSSIIHLTWAVVLLFEPSAIDVGPIYKVANFFGDNSIITSIVFFLAGSLAWIGGSRFKHDVVGVLLGIPQLLLIFISAESCMEVIGNGVHPDGTVGDALFFVAQLAGSMWLAPVYMVAVYGPYWKVLWTTRQSYRSRRS